MILAFAPICSAPQVVRSARRRGDVRDPWLSAHPADLVAAHCSLQPWSYVRLAFELPSHQLTWKCTDPCRKTTVLLERAFLHFHVSWWEGMSVTSAHALARRGGVLRERGGSGWVGWGGLGWGLGPSLAEHVLNHFSEQHASGFPRQGPGFCMLTRVQDTPRSVVLACSGG